MPNYCYWSIGDGEYGRMLAAVVKSARKCGVKTDFHLWTNYKIDDCDTHSVGTFNKAHYLFKLEFLKNEVSQLPYDYFVFLDADNYFVRDPGDLLRLMHLSPIHVSLESNCNNPKNKRPDWWGCPLGKYDSLMRQAGVMSKEIYNCNAGFWIVQKKAVNLVYELAMNFWRFCTDKGVTFTEEAPLSYAMQMLCADTEKHTLRATNDVWASDWTGAFKDRLPDGSGWQFEDYFTAEKLMVNPAIVHCMRSKNVMI